jgi:hypothetical protein
MQKGSAPGELNIGGVYALSVLSTCTWPKVFKGIQGLLQMAEGVILCYMCLCNTPSGVSLLGSILVRLLYPAEDRKITLSLTMLSLLFHITPFSHFKNLLQSSLFFDLSSQNKNPI